MQVVLAVAAGGALGALARYGTTELFRALFDLRGVGTVAANILGALLLGLVVGLTEQRWSPSDAVRIGLTVGLLGGFTTFSTYMGDVFFHLEAGRPLVSGALLVATVAAGLAAMLAGLWAGRAL